MVNLRLLLSHPELLLYAFLHPATQEIKLRYRQIAREERKKELASLKSKVISKSERKFLFNGREYEYFYHDYNEAWASERTVEVPIIWDIVKSNKDARILEVGNVLPHYFGIQHTVLDKYEVWPGVTNEDIMSYSPGFDFDLIVSISTLEHIGWSLKRGVREPSGFIKAVNKLESLLAHGGELWFTVPLGYNPYVNKAVEKELVGAELFFMKRISADNKWRQCSFNDVKTYPYGGFKLRNAAKFPYPKANAIMICLIKR